MSSLFTVKVGYQVLSYTTYEVLANSEDEVREMYSDPEPFGADQFTELEAVTQIDTYDWDVTHEEIVDIDIDEATEVEGKGSLGGRHGFQVTRIE